MTTSTSELRVAELSVCTSNLVLLRSPSIEKKVNPDER
jgi:hypothetical protein